MGVDGRDVVHFAVGALASKYEIETSASALRLKTTRLRAAEGRRWGRARDVLSAFCQSEKNSASSFSWRRASS